LEKFTKHLKTILFGKKSSLKPPNKPPLPILPYKKQSQWYLDKKKCPPKGEHRNRMKIYPAIQKRSPEATRTQLKL